MKNGNKHRFKLLNAGAAMRPYDLESMSTDELWTLREKIAAALSEKLAAEKTYLETRLRQLRQGVESVGNNKNVGHARRPYPRVFPKFKNPAQPSETWAGRGKQPRWLTAQLRSGKKLDDFRIQPSSGRARDRGR
jgi:DNA-binding protein H-NS